MITTQQKIHGAIHTAALAAAAIGGGLAQLPGSDAPILVKIQTAMIIAIAREHRVEISTTTAAKVLLTFSATYIGRVASQWLLGWIPVLGNSINATTAAALTEAIGWAADGYFQKNTSAAACAS